MAGVIKRFISNIILTGVITTLFMGGMYIYGSKIRADSLFTILVLNYLLFCSVPLVLYQLFIAKKETLKISFFKNGKLSLWISIAISLIIGWVVGNFQMNEFDTSGFDWYFFFLMTTICFVIFYILTFIFLFLGTFIHNMFAKIRRV